MAGKNQAVLLLATVVLCAICGISFATTYTVGDTTGWTTPSSASVYPNWASGKNFKVGDTLVFNFPTGVHTVAEVNKANFDSCNSASTIGAVLTSGPANVTLKSAGTHYYICTVGTHCRVSNQKLSIVVAASSATAPASSPTSPTSGATPPSGSTAAPAASPSTPTGGAASPSGSTSSPSGSPVIPAADGPSTTSAPAPSFASSTSVGVLSLVSIVVAALVF